MKTDWRPTRLGDVLQQIRRSETVQPVKTYDLIGVRLDGAGPFLRETKTGDQISAGQLFRVAAGDFIYSRLFAWRGAFGTIGSRLDGKYVSGEFPTFVADPEQLDVEFLKLWFLLPPTLRTVESLCSGSTPLTRNRFKEQFFLKLEIPLPPLAEQQRIVARIDALAARIEEIRSLHSAVMDDLKRMLLGMYEELTNEALSMPMAQVAPIVRRPVEVEPDAEYSELGIRSFGNGTFHKSPQTGLQLGSKRVFQIEPGDLLFSNVFAWEGAIAVVKPEDAGRIGSHRFISCVPKPDLATAEFLRFHFLTPAGLMQIGEASPGGAGRNRTLGLGKLESLGVPVPPLEKQRWFDDLQAKVDAVKCLQAETQAELDALLPAVLDRAFRGEL